MLYEVITVWIIFACYILWLIGEGLEQAWGSLRVNLFIISSLISLLFFFALPAILPPAPAGVPEQEFSVDLYSRGMFLLLPIYGLILKLFYRRCFYLEHLVYTAYLFSAMFLALGVMMAMEGAAEKSYWAFGLQLLSLAYVLWRNTFV